MDPRVEKMAGVLVNYCLAVQPEQWVVINTELPGQELAAACTRAIVEAGGYPTTNFSSDAIEEITFGESTHDQLRFISPAMRAVMEQADALIQIRAPANTRMLSGISPQRLALRNKALEPLMDTYMERFINRYRVVITEAPTQANAQDAGMSLREYEDFVYRAAMVEEIDPVVAWGQMGDRLKRLEEWLQGKSEVHVIGDGIDLRVGVQGRTWMCDDGHLNFPGGEIFTKPHEDSVDGTVDFNFPGFYQGQEVTGVHLRFERGSVVDAHATGNDAFLQATLGTDEGARRLGEFAFGTNYNIQKFTRNVLFDEKIGGTLHMALGRSIPQTHGENRSAVHWDMVFDLRKGTRILVDGQLLSENGVFAIEGA